MTKEDDYMKKKIGKVREIIKKEKERVLKKRSIYVLNSDNYHCEHTFRRTKFNKRKSSLVIDFNRTAYCVSRAEVSRNHFVRKKAAEFSLRAKNRLQMNKCLSQFSGEKN